MYSPISSLIVFPLLNASRINRSTNNYQMNCGKVAKQSEQLKYQQLSPELLQGEQTVASNVSRAARLPPMKCRSTIEPSHVMLHLHRILLQSQSRRLCNSTSSLMAMHYPQNQQPFPSSRAQRTEVTPAL